VRCILTFPRQTMQPRRRNCLRSVLLWESAVTKPITILNFLARGRS
jgi:hypothetical protein